MYLQLIYIRRPRSYELSFASNRQNLAQFMGLVTRPLFLTDQLCMVRKNAFECFGFGSVV